MFVVSGQNSPLVELYDADTFDRIGGIQLPGAQYADVLACSQNSNDPFVYYSTEDSTRDMVNRGRAGRINIVTQTHDSQIDDPKFLVSDMLVSPDGTQLYGFKSAGQSFVTTYTSQDGVGHLTNTELRMDTGGGCQMALHPRHALACVGYSFVEPDLKYALGSVVPISSQKSGLPPNNVPIPLAFFSDLPLCLAIDAKASTVSLVSSNSFKSLAEIPLPGDWKQNEFSTKAIQDIRWRRETAEGLITFFLWAQADNQRQRAIMVTNDYVVIVPTADNVIPTEPLLTMTSPLPDFVSVGKPNMIELGCSIEGATFEFVPGPESRFGQYTDQHPLPGDVPPESTRYSRLNLQAAVNSNQTAILVETIDPVKGRELPFRIRIDDEVLTVTKAEDFSDSLTVDRADGQPHNVTAQIEIIEESTTQVLSDLPSVQGNTLTWTPSAAQLGNQLVILKIRLGDVSREICWRVRVDQHMTTIEPLPFVVDGIESYSESSAIVWGGQATPDNARRADTIGVFDFNEGRLTRSEKLTSLVLSVAAHGDRIYAAIEDLPEKPGYSQILVLESGTLKTVRTIETTSGCKSLTVVGGKYLIGTDGSGIPETQLSLPDFKPLSAEERTSDPLTGRVGDGWSWNGAIWDSRMKKARLLMIPRAATLELLDSLDGMTDPLGGQIERKVGGPFVYSWIPRQRYRGDKLPSVETTIPDYPGGFTIEPKNLCFYSWSKSWVERSGDAPRILVSKVVPLEGSVGMLNAPSIAQHRVEVCTDRVLVSTGPGIFSFPLTDFLPKEETPWFRFLEEQDSISLNISKPSKISYSAPGAAEYQLQFFLSPSMYGDTPPLYSLKSANGSFTLSWAPADQIIAAASDVCGLQFAGSNYIGKIDETIKKYNAEYKLLTGKALSGVPVPIYASVNAVHQDGKQKAGMLHCYIFEVPKSMLLH